MDIRSHIDRYSPLNWSLKYRVIVFLTLALVLMPIVLVAANDIFSDVPSDHMFHDNISAIYGARITSGTTATTFSPEDPATRGQIAAFLHRGLPRVAFNTRDSIGLTATSVDAAVVTITTGGAPGGTGFVKLDASITAFNSSSTGCPCEVEYLIEQDYPQNQSFRHFLTINNDIGGVDSNAEGAATWVVSVPTASTQTFSLKVKKNSGTATVSSIGALTALYVPFGATGGNTLNPPAIAPLAASEAQEVKARTTKGNN